MVLVDSNVHCGVHLSIKGYRVSLGNMDTFSIAYILYWCCLVNMDTFTYNMDTLRVIWTLDNNTTTRSVHIGTKCVHITMRSVHIRTNSIQVSILGRNMSIFQ